MKENMCVEDLINIIDQDNLLMYVGNGVSLYDNVDKRIVLFAHELERSEALNTLRNMAKVLVENNYVVFLVAKNAGELIEEFIDLGVSVILYDKITDDAQWLIKITQVFPQIIINSIVFIDFLIFLAPYSQKIYWWIHESEKTIENWREKAKEIPDVPALCIWAASPLIQKKIREYWKWESELLNIYIEDVPVAYIENRDKIRLINIGDVNGNRGQEVLIKAFEKLDEETKTKCELYFCVENKKYNEELLLEVLDYVDAKENVYILEGMSKTELYEIYDQMHIVVDASWYESVSVDVIEGLMKEKLCICTENGGVCEYLNDGENVFTFQQGDIEKLKEILENTINRYYDLEKLRKNGRKVYENVYTKEIFSKRLLELMEGSVQINKEMNRCTGCGACMSSCPVGAITMERDKKGFLYPKIDDDKCIKCKKCVMSCPVNEISVNEAGSQGYALKRVDKGKLKESQSGGAFSVLAEEILEQGGIVYGVALDTNCRAEYIRVDKEEELIRLKGSKYVQADLNDTYALVREDIKEKRVLFSGTPCYVAGLKKYLQNENTQNLITCDLVCHGVPSPKVYESHLEYLRRRYKKVITDFKFRDKEYSGWHRATETFTNGEGKVVAEIAYANIFYTDACLRESCYSCRYAAIERPADITIGDFWGVENVFPEMDDNTGVSLVFVNSGKGRSFFDKVLDHVEVEIKQTEIANCLQGNLKRPTARASMTEEFWNDYFNYDYRKVVRKYGQVSFYNQANLSVLNCWQKKLDKGESLAAKLLERGLSKILITGDKKNNELAIMELTKGGCVVVGEIQYNGTEVSGKVPIVSMDEELTKCLEQVDTILITNESDMVDILTELHNLEVPMEKLTPISFVLDEEV